MPRRLVPVLLLALLPSAISDARAAPPPELQEVVPVVSRIRGLSVGLEMFENDGRASLGLSYDYARDLDLVRDPGWIHTRLTASGHVAFRSRLNPHDFLTTRAGIGFRKSLGGGARDADRSRAALQQAAVEAAGLESAEAVEAFLDTSGAVLRYEESLRPAVSLDFELDGGLESDQRFTRKQWVAGAGLTTEVDLWGPSRRANLFDYPFALFRYLAGTGPFGVLGSTVPIVTVGVDLVSPRGGDPRSELLGERDDFVRARAEAGFRTEVTRNGSRVVHASATWRVYRELGAAEAVRDAGLDRASYVVVTLSTSAGAFVSYTDGRLPLDAENAQAYALGWEFDW